MRAGLRGSFLYSSAVRKKVAGQLYCRLCVCAVFLNEIRVPLISSFLRWFSSPGIPVMRNNGYNVQAAREVARELMPYAMTRPVITALAPLSPKYGIVVRASRFHPSRVIGLIVGYRTGGVERPHGLDCYCEDLSALCFFHCTSSILRSAGALPP